VVVYLLVVARLWKPLLRVSRRVFKNRRSRLELGSIKTLVVQF
jgi:hypothetical protein